MPIVLGPAPPSLFPSVLSFWGVATDIASSTDDLPGLAALRGAPNAPRPGASPARHRPDS